MKKRSVYEIATTLKPDEVLNAVEAFKEKSRFKPVNYRGEQVLQKGGWLFPALFLKVMPQNGSVRIETWVRSFGLLNSGEGLATKLRIKSAIDSLLDEMNKKDA